jgi:hypothetical protein
MAISNDTNTGFGTYLNAFFTDMLTGMSGPLSVPFAGLAVWASSRGQKALWGCLAAVCAMFASYRVWANERRQGSAQLALKEAELAELSERVVSLSQRKPRLKLAISAEGHPPSQVLKVVANRPITVSRVEYMLSTEASIAGEDRSDQGESVVIPINDSLLVKVWNTPRADRNNSDHSGPAKIRITVSDDGHDRQYILPIQMESLFQGSTNYRKVVGSKTFNESFD